MHKMIRVAATALALTAPPLAIADADEFTDVDLQRWQAEFDAVVAEGRAAFVDPKLGTNGVVCAQCHPNGAGTHPETYPKFQQQLGKVATMMEMVNWCIQNPLEGEPLALDDPKMTALLSYMAHERQGVAMSAGKH
jgi:thiosulfate dehydrogenase